jgi:hypothetical protein
MCRTHPTFSGTSCAFQSSTVSDTCESLSTQLEVGSSRMTIGHGTKRDQQSGCGQLGSCRISQCMRSDTAKTKTRREAFPPLENANPLVRGPPSTSTHASPLTKRLRSLRELRLRQSLPLLRRWGFAAALREPGLSGQPSSSTHRDLQEELVSLHSSTAQVGSQGAEPLGRPLSPMRQNFSALS